MRTGALRVAGYVLGLYVLQPQCDMVGMVVGTLCIAFVSGIQFVRNGAQV